jgi:hypothetical protein
MADNVAITAGSGTNIATDDIAGVHYQRMKLVDGTLDATTAIAAGGGVEAGALRVTVASDSTGVLSVDDNGSTISIDDGGSSITVDGSVTASLASGTNNIGDVDVLTVPAPLNVTGTGTESSALRVTIATDSTGVLSVDDNGASLTVDGTVASTQSGTWSIRNQDGSGNNLTSALRGSERALSVQLVDGSGNQVTSFGGGTQYTEDGASAGGETGTVFLGVRNDAAASKTSADGDFSAIATDSAGRVGIADLGGSVTVDGFTTVGGAAYVRLTDGTNTVSVNANGGLEVTGGVPHDSVDSGNPLKLGAKAEASVTAITNVADADRTDVYADINGVLITKDHVPYGDIIVTRVTDTGGTSTAFSAFGATASQRNYITTITVYNSSTTNGYVDLRDGAAGTVIYTIPLPALGGATISFQVPLRQPTVNTALCYDVSAAISTIYISAVGFKSF